MSSVHLARQGFITKATLPSVSRERGTTTTADRDTVLLLNGNGTNGKQNNTFVTENFGSAGGQGNYSVAFDGSGDFLSFTGVNSAFEFGTGDFTVECWVNPSATPADAYIWDFRPNSNGAYPSLDMQSSKFVYVANSAVRITGTTVPVVGQWYHVAISRSGTSTRMFVNGVQEGSTYTDSTNYVVASGRPYIGTDSFSNTLPFTGYISNFRIVKGTAVYTSAFTPPTSELTAISGTSLLTCQGTVIRDASSNNFAITVNGDAKVASNTSSGPIAITRNGNATQGSFSPFTLADGQWSNFFDGTGDYLTVNDTTSTLALGTGSFTIEMWIYATSLPTSLKALYDQRPANTQGAYPTIYINNGILSYYVSSSDRITSSTLATNTWYHIAVCRSGTNTRMFVNGVQVGSTFSDSTNYITASGRPSIGAFSDNVVASDCFGGYISNVRVVKGTALYTSAFTPPTTPLTAITNTSLLTCQSNRFRDASSNNFAITRNGDVRVTPWSPFAPTSAYDPSVNGGSGYFDGTGDFLNIPTATALDISSGDFTIEGWIYPNSVSSGVVYGLTDGTTISSATQLNSAIVLTSSTFLFRVYIGSSFFTVATTSASPNEWTHLALVRNGSTFTAYKNGVSVGTYTSSSNLNYGTGWRWGIGSFIGDTQSGQLNGYISNFRAVKGTAVYTANFTPPTAPVTNITNTSLLLNFTNAGIFDTAGDNVIETVGNAQIDTAIKKYGSGSLEFDGSGDYLLCYSPRLLPAGREPMTVEFWMRANSLPTVSTLISWGNRVSNNFVGITVTSSGNIGYTDWNTNLSSSGVTLTTNTWYHIACQYDGTNKQIYIDGVLRGSEVKTTYNTTATDRVTVGAQDGSLLEAFNGYIDDVRITKGRARYTANFTPPTAELVVFGTVPNIVNNSTYGVYQLA